MNIDDIKIELIEVMDSEALKTDLIASFTSDDKKIELLKYVEDIDYRARIIASLASEDKKIQLLKKIDYYYHENCCAEIIASLTSDDKKMALIDSVIYEGYKWKIIASLNSDDKKINFIKKLNKRKINRLYDKESLEDLLKSITSDEKKLDLMNSIVPEKEKNMRYAIMATLKSDEKKLEVLKDIKNKNSITNMIVSLTVDDDKKIELMNEMPCHKSKIIASLKSDERKLEFLKNIKGEDSITDIIVSLTVDDDKKIELMNEMPCRKSRIIASLKSNDKKLKLLESEYFEIYDKVLVMSSIRFDEIDLNKDSSESVEISENNELKDNSIENSEDKHIEEPKNNDLENMSVEELEKMNLDLDEKIKIANERDKKTRLINEIKQKMAKLKELEQQVAIESQKDTLEKIKE